jgi:sec-independent protein translocase protein TatB
MFGIGVGELFVILIIAVVVIGPQKLPEVARTIGRLFATAKRTTNQLRDQMHEEVRKFEDIEEVKEFKSVVQSELYNMQEATHSYVQHEMEQEEKRLESEVRNIEQALTAEGGPAPDSASDSASDSAPSVAPSIAPPADAPAAEAPAVAERNAEGRSAAAAGDTESTPVAVAQGETPVPPAEATASSAGNGSAPGSAREVHPSIPPASGSDKPVT